MFPHPHPTKGNSAPSQMPPPTTSTPATATAGLSLNGEICDRCFKRKKGCSRDERPCVRCKEQGYSAEECVARGGKTRPFEAGGDDQATASNTSGSRKGGQKEKQPAGNKRKTGKNMAESSPLDDAEEGEATAPAEAEAEAGNRAVAVVLGRDVQGGNVARLPVYDARAGIGAVAGRGIHVPVKVRRGGDDSGDESDGE